MNAVNGRKKIIEKKDKNYIEIIVNHYHNLKGSMSLEELQTVYSCIYPNSNTKLNKEDWAICNVNVENNNFQQVCEYLEKVNNRIDISKTDSLQTSEMFTNRLVSLLQPYHNDIYGVIEPFCDNKEQGLMVALYNQKTNDSLYIWSCESKTNKELMIITSKEKTNQNLYMADDLEKAQYYQNGHYDEALKYSLIQIDNFLDKNINLKF